MSLSHLEVLPEVLISAPPVGPYHINLLVSLLLMEVGIPHVVLFPVNWIPIAFMRRVMKLIHLTDYIPPMSDHSLLF